MNRITKNIYIGSWRDSVDYHQLVDNNIKYILGLNTRFKSRKEMDLYNQLNIKYMHIIEHDVPKTNIFKHFPKTNKFIHNAILHQKNILIHCTMGISRASTTVIAYLLWAYYIYDKEHNKYGFTQSEISIYKNQRRLRDILNYVGYYRPQINPNFGFLDQLQKYEKYIIKYLTD